MIDYIMAHLDPTVLMACAITTLGWSIAFGIRNHYLVRRIEVLEDKLREFQRYRKS